MKYYTTSTEYNCGIDHHARQMCVCVMDRQKLVHTNVRNYDFEFFLKLVAPYHHDLTVWAECMFGWCWLAQSGIDRSDVFGQAFGFEAVPEISSLTN